MGDRWVLSMDCPNCNYHDGEIYYAPTCGFTTWRCPNCKRNFEIVEAFKLIEIAKIGKSLPDNEK
jgi:hypothetical protein